MTRSMSVCVYDMYAVIYFIQFWWAKIETSNDQCTVIKSDKMQLLLNSAGGLKNSGVRKITLLE